MNLLYVHCKCTQAVKSANAQFTVLNYHRTRNYHAKTFLL